LQPNQVNGFWADADWLLCRDGRFRTVEPGTFPLVDGSSRSMVQGGDNSNAQEIQMPSPEAKIMRLKGYGNAINAEVAKNVIQAYLQTLNG